MWNNQNPVEVTLKNTDYMALAADSACKLIEQLYKIVYENKKAWNMHQREIGDVNQIMSVL